MSSFLILIYNFYASCLSFWQQLHNHVNSAYTSRPTPLHPFAVHRYLSDLWLAPRLTLILCSSHTTFMSRPKFVHLYDMCSSRFRYAEGIRTSFSLLYTVYTASLWTRIQRSMQIARQVAPKFFGRACALQPD